MNKLITLLFASMLSTFVQAEIPKPTVALLAAYDSLIETVMKSELATELNLPRCDQIGLVVKDIDSAVKSFEPLLGEFSLTNPGNMTYDYRGVEVDVDMSVATANHGDLRIEIIAVNSGASPHSEFLDAGKEGIQHIRFRVDDVEAVIKAAESLGYNYIWGKKFWILGSVAYLEKEGEPYFIELLDLPDLPIFP